MPRGAISMVLLEKMVPCSPWMRWDISVHAENLSHEAVRGGGACVIAGQGALCGR